MSNYNTLKTTIDANIKQNGNQEITGPILNSVLNQMVNILGTGYQFAGVATLDPATDPGTPDAKIFYIANGKGAYEKFGGLEVTEDEVVVLYWDTAWHKVVTGIASQAKLSELDENMDAISPMIVTDEKYPNITITPNKIVSASNGSLMDNQSFSPSAVESIIVSKNTRIRIYIPNSPIASGRGAAFYKEDGTFISGVPYVIGTTTYIVDVPSEATKLSLTSFGNDGFKVSIISPIEKIINDIDNKIETTSMSLNYDMVGESLTNGKFFNVNTHLFVDNASYGYYKIYLAGGTRFKVKSSITNSAIGIGFFDNDDKYISSVGYSSSEVSAIFPTNALYAIVTRHLYLSFSLEICYNDVNSLQRSLYNPLKPSSNPFANIGKLPSYITMFKKIVHIGDSLTRGQYNTTSPNTNGADIPSYSRPVFMGRMIGNENVNLGIGGSAAALSSNHPWLTEAQSGYIFPWTDFTNPGDCYIIALGTNDISQLGSFTGDVSIDIDIADYHNNATTSVGGYATIIQMILEIQPKAKIFCVTIPNTRNDATTRINANAKIKAVADLFGCYVIDLEMYGESSENGRFAKTFKNASHNNALGYAERARQYIAYIDWIIENHLDEFRNVQFIGTDYDYQ